MKRLIMALLLLSQALFARPKRVVATSPALSQIMLELKASSLLAGVTPFCNAPSNIPRIGTAISLKLEKLVATSPDLILLEKTKSKQTAKLLEKLGLKTLEFKLQNKSDLLAAILHIGRLLGKEELARELVQKIHKSLMAPKGLAPKDVAVIFSAKGLGEKLTEFFVVAPNTLHHEILKSSGLENAIKKAFSGPPLLSLQRLLAISPQALVFISLSKGQQTALKKKAESTPLLEKFKKFFIVKKNGLINGPKAIELTLEFQQIYAQL